MPRRATARTTAATLPLLCLTMLLGGCKVLGLIADKTAGQIPVEPKYVPAADVPLVVLVENYRTDAATSRSDADRVAQILGERLAERKVAPIVAFEKVQALRDKEGAAFDKLGVVQIARELDAGQVLYVDLTAVSVGAAPGSDIGRAAASAKVRFIDVKKNEVVWPGDLAEGATIEAASPQRRVADGITVDSLRVEALRQLSERIARLFFKYKPDDLEVLGDTPESLQ